MIVNSDPDTAYSLDPAGLQSALDRLVTAGTLTQQQSDDVLLEIRGCMTSRIPAQADPSARATLTATPSTPPATSPRPVPWMALLAEAGGYVGSIFVLSSALVLVGPRWDNLSHWARVLDLGLPALALLTGAAILMVTTPGGWQVEPGNGSPARRRLISALLVLAAGLSASLAAELVGGGDEVWPTGSFLAVSAVGYLFCRGPLLHLATGVSLAWFGGMAAFLYGGDQDWWRSGGLGVALAGAAWLALSLLRRLRERELGLALGAAGVFIGGEMLTSMDFSPEPGYITIALLVVLTLTGYVRTQTISLLAAGVISLAVIVPQTITHYAEGELGAAGGLLITGLSIIGASLFGLRLRHEVTHSA